MRGRAAAASMLAAALACALLECNGVFGIEPATRIEGGVLPIVGDGGGGNSGDGSTTPACGADTSRDPQNCGVCGHRCLDGKSCTNGMCPSELIATGLCEPSAIAQLGSSVYYTIGTCERAVRYSPVTGGASSLLAPAMGFGVPLAVAARPGAVYYGGNDARGVFECPEPPGALCTPKLLAMAWPTAISADDREVCWLNYGGGPAQQLECCPASGCGDAGGRVVVAAKPMGDVVLAGDFVYWSESGSDGDDWDGLILKQSRSGCGPCTPTVLARGQAGPTSISVAGGFVYWVNVGSPKEPIASVMRVADRDGSDAPQSIRTGLVGPQRVAADGKYVYITVYNTTDLVDAKGTLVRCPAVGCKDELVVLASGLARPMGLALGGDYVYWVNAGPYGKSEGSIARVPR